MIVDDCLLDILNKYSEIFDTLRLYLENESDYQLRKKLKTLLKELDDL